MCWNLLHTQRLGLSLPLQRPPVWSQVGELRPWEPCPVATNDVMKKKLKSTVSPRRRKMILQNKNTHWTRRWEKQKIKGTYLDLHCEISFLQGKKKRERENLKCFQRGNKRNNYWQTDETDTISKLKTCWLSNSSSIASCNFGNVLKLEFCKNPSNYLSLKQMKSTWDT